MTNPNSFILSLSVLYRNVQKYFDYVLAPYDIGSGQLIFLLFINENEGCTMQEVTRKTHVDKGTTTKAVNRLIEQEYVRIAQDENDKRIKHLHTTEKAAVLMREIYEFRTQCRNVLAEGNDFAKFEEILTKAAENSCNKLVGHNEEALPIKIGGFLKMTLLDFPSKVACTVFTAGCNFKCPFCHNRDLVYIPENYEFYDPKDILEYLEKRRGILDGVAISGGEPMLQNSMDLIQQIKDMGYLVKLDTNGYYPKKLKEYIESGLIDYVAMDIKNCREKYAMTCGIAPENFRIENIEESMNYLLEGHVDYEFRTTVVREFHNEEDLIKIAHKIKNANHYYLQQYVDSGNTIAKDSCSAYSNEEMKELMTAVSKIMPNVSLRGVK